MAKQDDPKMAIVKMTVEAKAELEEIKTYLRNQTGQKVTQYDTLNTLMSIPKRTILDNYKLMIKNRLGI